MLGGMSWESTQSYYRAVNEGVRDALGGLHSAKIVLYSVDFAEIEFLQRQGNWSEAAELLAYGAQGVERAGAEFLILCTNTMHKVAPAIQERIGIPMLHIAEATAGVLLEEGILRVGLLGTRFTMEQTFYREKLEEKGIEVILPNANERTTVHEVIYNELCLGIINQQSKARFLEIIELLRMRGANAVILGCTEIALLIQQRDTSVALYDTTEIHAAQAVKYALQDV